MSEQVERNAESGVLAPGTVISGFRIERELGRGAMAVVYLATQLDLDRPVAFKVMSAELAAVQAGAQANRRPRVPRS